MSMNFPDQRIIDHVRDELWSNARRASVMIGAGFSKHASPSRPGVDELPLWDDLTNEMCAKLHVGGQRGMNCEDCRVKPSTNDALSLAQDFENKHGKGALHHFLEQQVRDRDFNPGDLHVRLLKLPWRDVFTTNWDTLLERTRTLAPERQYEIVHNKDQLPIAKQPRIFKLHGSLGGHYPLIATHGDYDDYQVSHAPFVNTVQQSMMETVLLMVGFSGNDPNFARWSDWVDENLGSAAPKIYLAGFLDLSEWQLEFYRCRNIVPIDLARHPKANSWPEHLRHNYATNWILTTLEFGRPYDVIDWPKPDVGTFGAPANYLIPVERRTTDTPVEEPWRPERSEDSQVSVEPIREVVRIWSHNRCLYPGWLMAPLEVRGSIVGRTRECSPYLLQCLNQLDPTEQLCAIRELIWRHEITLQPLNPEIATVASEILGMFDCEARTIKGQLGSETQWSQVREAWRAVALSLVTHERYQLNQDMFFLRLEELNSFISDDLNVAHRIQHERCLWAAWSLDFEELRQLLRNWNTDNCDPMWVLRKAALLAEIGNDETVTTLRDSALGDIERFPEDDRSVTRASREGWALWSKFNFDNQSSVVNRWNELASRKCDAFAELASTKTAFSSRESDADETDFDGRAIQRSQIRFSFADSTAPAYRAIRITEVAGLALATRNALDYGASGAENVRLASTQIQPSNAELAIRLVLRSCSSENAKELTQVLSRSRVAVLSNDAVGRLATDCAKMIDFALSEGNPDRLRVAVEVLSRLVPRLQPHSALGTFDKALALYRNRVDPVASHLWVGPPLRNLLNRAWKSLDSEDRTARALEALSSPIVDLDDFRVQDPRSFPDPGELFDSIPETCLPTRDDDNAARWKNAVDITIRALKSVGQSREKALTRLLPIVVHGFLTEDETSQVADALWVEGTSTDDWVPRAIHCPDWVFLILPEPEDRFATTRFRRKWLSDRAFESKLDYISTTRNLTLGFGRNTNDPRFIEDTIWNLGEAIVNLPRFNRSFELANDESALVTSMISNWAKSSIKTNPFPLFQREINASIEMVIEGLGSVLPVVPISKNTGDSLFEKFVALTDADIPAYKPVAGLIRAIPHRSAEIAAWLRKGLAASDRNKAFQAMSGLANWLQSSERDACPGPPDDLVSEIGLIIAARRKENVAGALEVAEWLFLEGKHHLWTLLIEPALVGLNHLATELSYDQELGDEEAFRLRLRCAKLASSMSKAGLSDRPAVGTWLEIAANDPYPEIRQMLDR